MGSEYAFLTTCREAGMSGAPSTLGFNQPGCRKRFQEDEILGIGTAGEKLDSVQIFSPEGARHGRD
ncbi:hypothetical protein FQZ97_1094230 [compost metagenome]